MSELDRYRRILGLRASMGPKSVPPVVPVIDGCTLRMDAPGNAAPFAAGAYPAIGIGSVLLNAVIDPGAGGVIAGSLMAQNPGNFGSAVALAVDHSAFFRPGHWRVDMEIATNLGNNVAISVEARPWDFALKQYVVRGFQGNQGGVAATPQVQIMNFVASNNVTRHLGWEAFMPEPWGIFITAVTALADTDRVCMYGSAQLHCPIDDAPASLDPGLLR